MNYNQTQNKRKIVILAAIIFILIAALIYFMLKLFFTQKSLPLLEKIIESTLPGLFIGILCTLIFWLLISKLERSESEEDKREIFEKFDRHETLCFDNQSSNLKKLMEQAQNFFNEFKNHETECFSIQKSNFRILESNFNKLIRLSNYYKEKERAGIESIFSSRNEDESIISIFEAFSKYMEDGSVNESQKVRILGTSLRAFSKFGGMYYKHHNQIESLYKNKNITPPPILTEKKKFKYEEDDHTNLLIRILNENPKIKIKMIVLNPYCFESYFRAQAEDENPNKAFDTIEDYQGQDNPCLYSDIIDTVKFVRKIKNEFEGRIEIKLSFFMNSMFLLMFPDFCFKQQYIMDKRCARGAISSIPLTKFKKDSETYKRLKTHFDFMWNRAKDLDQGEKHYYAKGTTEGFMFNIYQEIAKLNND